MWTELISLVLNVNLGEADNKWEWRLGKNKLFLVKSMYRDLMMADSLPKDCILDPSKN